MTAIIRGGLLFGMIAVVAGCGASEDEELTQYIHSIKSQPKRPIEPIPEYKPLPAFVYPEGDSRRSPFKPMVAPRRVEQFAPNTNRPKQPLEAFPLDALKFVGILKEGPIIWALISQPNGLVSRVKQGDYMGQHYGQVLSIKDNEIKIVEYVQSNDVWEKKPVTINLQVPAQTNTPKP